MLSSNVESKEVIWNSDRPDKPEGEHSSIITVIKSKLRELMGVSHKLWVENLLRLSEVCLFCKKMAKEMEFICNVAFLLEESNYFKDKEQKWVKKALIGLEFFFL